MNVLKRLLLSIGILTASVTAYATPIYTQQNPSATQAGAFNVVGGTITTKLSLPFLLPSSFVQTDAQGNLVTPSATATNYIQNRSGLQAGATAYPDFLYVGSSATIPLIGGSTITYSSATFTNAAITGVLGSTISYSSATFSLANITGLIGSTVTFSSATFTKANVSTLTVSNLAATSTNDNACPTCYGFTVSSGPTDVRNFATSGNYADFSALTLPAGDWDVFVCMSQSLSGSTTQVLRTGQSQTSGNSWPDEAIDRQVSTTAVAVAGMSLDLCSQLVRWSLSASTTIFQKARADYTVGTPTGTGYMRAVRRR